MKITRENVAEHIRNVEVQIAEANKLLHGAELNYRMAKEYWPENPALLELERSIDNTRAQINILVRENEKNKEMLNFLDSLENLKALLDEA